jgi:hypothetical protein
MKQYLLAINQPDGPPPPSVDLDRVMKDVDAMLRDMKAVGAWVFNGALHPASTATVIRLQDGEDVLTDGPYVEGKEHVGGLCIINAPDLDAALDWARKLARAVAPLPIEVRPFQQEARDR